ncbi:MAG: DUF4956 domain-containing protein [Cyclobacteriaceae bacterium]|nr:DUF4956 domain-containing protein [Cyclobacteriaceae bacterium]UYN88389.1 MAG: DUF4956 domain-containing protein [Cyclobacteriaceae bacterium]
MDNLQLFSEYFLVRLLINIISMVVLIRFIYYRTYLKRNLFFTFFLLNFIVFLLTFMLEKAKAFNSLGSAFGLLAAFSLLRFRTETLSAKDMTYLFIIMALGLINSIMRGSYPEIMMVNGLILTAVFAVDGNVLMRNQKTKTVEYEGLEYIQSEHHPKLILELRKRTGLDIQKISIERIDFGRNRVEIKMYYF